MWEFYMREEPEYRDLDAFDFVYTEFGELARNLGQVRARIEHDTLVSRAVSRGIEEIGIETTITILIYAEYMEEKDGALHFKMPVYANGPLPSAQMRSHHAPRPGTHEQSCGRTLRMSSPEGPMAGHAMRSRSMLSLSASSRWATAHSVRGGCRSLRSCDGRTFSHPRSQCACSQPRSSREF
jgi:hypothetical protein